MAVMTDRSAITSAPAAPARLKSWNIAPMPQNGDTTAPLGVYAFAIDKHTSVAAAAFEAMTYLLARQDLIAACDAAPVSGDRLAFYRKYVDPPLSQRFRGNKVNWQVAVDMEKYADSPSYQAILPNDAAAGGDVDKAFTRLTATPGLDMDTTIASLVAALQADYDAAP
jgi:hypothetical protein